MEYSEFLIFGTAFVISFFTFPIAIVVINEFRLHDAPGGRKIHSVSTPSLGGMPIFFGIILSIIFWMPISKISEHKFLIASLIITFILGLRDDLISLKASQKLIGQLIPASLLIFFADIRFTSLYGLFGIYEIPFWVSVMITIFTFIVVTNAFNLIDGIDGLAGSLGIIAVLFFGTWLMLISEMYHSFFCFAFVGAYLAFLNYNWAPSKIFMGDTGSLLLGFFIAATTIFFIDTNYYLDEKSPFKFQGGIATGMAVIIVPLYDTMRVFVKRIMVGRSPMSPDKNHLHHVLLKFGYKHAGVAVILVAVSLSFVGLVVFLKDYNDRITLPIVVSIAIIMGAVLDYRFRIMIKSKRQSGDKKDNEVIMTKSA